MTYRVRASLAAVLVFGLLSLVLSSCLSLTQDITPPPEISSTATQPEEDTPPTPPPAETQEEGLESSALEGGVTVEVIDRSGGALPQQDLVVKLEGFDQFDQVFEVSQELPLSAMVNFSNVPFKAGRIIFASVAYGGAVYRSEIVQVSEDTPALSLQVPIFETTTERAGLVIERLHLLIEFPASDMIQVSEIFILSNLGAETVVAESPGQASVEFSLPEGAQSLVFEDGALGQRYLLTDSGFADTVSILPGQGVYQVLVSYLLPYERGRLNFAQPINHPLNAHVVLVPAGDVKVKSSSLEDQGLQSVPGGDIRVYTGSSIAAGDELIFKLIGSPYRSAEGTPIWIMIGLGVAGLGLLVSGAWLYFDSRNKDVINIQEADGILDSIIALEDLFQEGKITEPAYQKKRDQLKDQLRDLTSNE